MNLVVASTIFGVAVKAYRNFGGGLAQHCKYLKIFQKLICKECQHNEIGIFLPLSTIPLYIPLTEISPHSFIVLNSTVSNIICNGSLNSPPKKKTPNEVFSAAKPGTSESLLPRGERDFCYVIRQRN